MKQVAAYMSDRYIGKTLAVYTHYCPGCLKKGTPEVLQVPRNLEERKAFWSGLFEQGALDPFIVLNYFVPSHTPSKSHFSKPLIDLNQPGARCTKGMHCDPICIFCNCYVDNALPYYITKSSSPFNAHPGCLSRCTYVEPGSGKKHQCKEPVPRIPCHYTEFQNNMCKRHGALASMSHEDRIEAARVMSLKRFEAPGAMAVEPQKTAPKPPAPKPKPANPTPSKLARMEEGKYSHDIRGMFKSKEIEVQKEVQKQGGYQRPEVVFTPHAKNPGKQGRYKRRRLSSPMDDSP